MRYLTRCFFHRGAEVNDQSEVLWLFESALFLIGCTIIVIQTAYFHLRSVNQMRTCRLHA